MVEYLNGFIFGFSSVQQTPLLLLLCTLQEPEIIQSNIETLSDEKHYL